MTSPSCEAETASEMVLNSPFVPTVRVDISRLSPAKCLGVIPETSLNTGNRPKDRKCVQHFRQILQCEIRKRGTETCVLACAQTANAAGQAGGVQRSR